MYNPLPYPRSPSGCHSGDGARNPELRTYDPRLMSYMAIVLDTIEEHDLRYPDQDTLLSILESALDARARLVQSSLHQWTPPQMEALLRNLLIFALEPASAMEVV